MTETETETEAEAEALGGWDEAHDIGIQQVYAVDCRNYDRWTFAKWRNYLLLGRRPEPLPSYRGLVESPVEGKIGITCSGGGVRSAAFSLGALQKLQQEGVLERSSYLACVSGGSYIASAFCLLRKTWSSDRKQADGAPAEEGDGRDDSDPDVVTRTRPPFYPGSPEEQYLRNRSSYMAHGFAGWTRLILRVVIGLTLNLAFLLLTLLLLASGLALLYGVLYPDLLTNLDAKGKCGTPECDFSSPVPRGLLWVLVLTAATGLLSGAVSFVTVSNLRDACEVWAQRLILASLVGGLVLVGLPELLAWWRSLGAANNPTPAQTAAGGSAATKSATFVVSGGGLIAVASAVAAHVRAGWVRAQGVAESTGKVIGSFRKLSNALQETLAYALAALVVPLIALVIALITMSASLNIEDWDARVERFVVIGAAFIVAYFLADLTTWSLHSFYRRRLSTAFALRRVRSEKGPETEHGSQAIAVERDPDRRIPLSSSFIPEGPASPHGGESPERWHWPTLLVCAAANVSDNAATPPGRSVTSFTFSASSVGGPLVGALPTRDLEDACDEKGKSLLTVPAAVAMSGAALAPSMGKMTRKPLRFLLGVANVRLGVWVPNPRRIARFDPSKYPTQGLLKSAKRAVQPPKAIVRPRPSYLFRELFGISPISAPYVYVTDGGHYENLGLVELLRRGCTEIYVIDASQDRLDALGDAVSLARSELGVNITDFDRSLLDPDAGTGCAAQNCTDAKIEYPPHADGTPGDKGKIIFVRAVMTEGLPMDILAYHARDPKFPQNSTGDQLYKDQRFEAYRALGVAAASNAMGLKAGTYPKPPPRTEPSSKAEQST